MMMMMMMSEHASFAYTSSIYLHPIDMESLGLFDLDIDFPRFRLIISSCLSGQDITNE